MAQREHIVVIGAGSTGSAIAHDLSLRGFVVTVVERGEIASGTTGRNHALLHSGARYVVKDPEAARECMEDNALLRRLAPGVIEPVGGLFVGIDEEDEAYLDPFLAGCAEAGIPTRRLSREEALRYEPALNPNLRVAVVVPDAVFDPYRLVAAWLATAQSNGARVWNHCRVVGFHLEGRQVVGVRVVDDLSGRTLEVGADLVVNAAGPWSGRVAALAGARVSVVPSGGVMVAVDRRLTGMVVNRLRLPGDGDILVPQRQTTLIGTTSWVTEELDPVPIPPDHVEQMMEVGARLIPAVRETPIKTAWASARPLMGGNLETDGREISRGFQVIDHGEYENLPGLVSVVGGKTTTSRLMAEALGERVCQILNRARPCPTTQVPLEPYYRFRPDLDRRPFTHRTDDRPLQERRRLKGGGVQ